MDVCERFNFSDSSIAFLKLWKYRFSSFFELSLSFTAVFRGRSREGDGFDTEISGDKGVCPLFARFGFGISCDGKGVCPQFARFGFGISCEECNTAPSRDEEDDDAEASYAEDEESGGYDMSYSSSSS